MKKSYMGVLKSVLYQKNLMSSHLKTASFLP